MVDTVCWRQGVRGCVSDLFPRFCPVLPFFFLSPFPPFSSYLIVTSLDFYWIYVILYHILAGRTASKGIFRSHGAYTPTSSIHLSVWRGSSV